jgi:hypothetical protein
VVGLLVIATLLEVVAFGADDPRVAGAHVHHSAAMSLPTEPGSLKSSLDATAVTRAWSWPEPDSSARWGTKPKGPSC